MNPRTIIKNIFGNIFATENDLGNIVISQHRITTRAVATVVVNGGNVASLIKNLITNASYRRGNSEFGKTCTAVEGASAYGLSRFGNDKLGELGALGECFLADGSYLIAIDVLGNGKLTALKAADAGDGAGLVIRIYRIAKSYVGKRRNGYLDSFFTTGGTLLVSVTSLGIGGLLLYYPIALPMTESSNVALTNDNLAAGGAVLSLTLACCGAGGRNSGVDYLGMSKSLYNYLLLKDFFTSVTNHTFGRTRFGTGRVLGRKNGDGRVIALNVTNEATYLAGGVEVTRIGMLEHRNFLLCKNNLATDGAMLSFGLARLSAGRQGCLVNNNGVAESENVLGLFFSAIAIARLLAILFASGSFNYFPLIKGMSVSRSGVIAISLPVTFTAAGCKQRDEQKSHGCENK